jgi:hypothetical protein
VAPGAVGGVGAAVGGIDNGAVGESLLGGRELVALVFGTIMLSMRIAIVATTVTASTPLLPLHPRSSIVRPVRQPANRPTRRNRGGADIPFSNVPKL